jgi:cytochrome c biogenesis protein CcdA
MKDELRRWRRSRPGQLTMVAGIAYVVFCWYQDLRSPLTRSWVVAHASDGGWAAVFLVGIVVGTVIGTCVGPLLLDALGIRKLNVGR